MNKNIIAAAFLFLTVIFFSPAKSLAITAYISAADLAKETKIIVQGEVVGVKSYKGVNDIIHTRASVLVSDVVKGKIAKKNITVEYKSGEVGDNSFSAEDEPSLEKGEQVLLFLTNSFWRKNVYYIVGGVSGKYKICSDNTVATGSSCDEGDGAADQLPETKQTLEELLSKIENIK